MIRSRQQVRGWLNVCHWACTLNDVWNSLECMLISSVLGRENLRTEMETREILINCSSNATGDDFTGIEWSFSYRTSLWSIINPNKFIIISKNFPNCLFSHPRYPESWKSSRDIPNPSRSSQSMNRFELIHDQKPSLEIFFVLDVRDPESWKSVFFSVSVIAWWLILLHSLEYFHSLSLTLVYNILSMFLSRVDPTSE